MILRLPGPGAGFRTRCEYVPVRSAPAFPGGRRSGSVQAPAPAQSPMVNEAHQRGGRRRRGNSVLCGESRSAGTDEAVGVRPGGSGLAREWRCGEGRAGGSVLADRRPPGWVRQALTKRSLVRSRTTPICDGRLEGAEPTGMYLWRVRRNTAACSARIAKCCSRASPLPPGRTHTGTQCPASCSRITCRKASPYFSSLLCPTPLMLRNCCSVSGR